MRRTPEKNVSARISGRGTKTKKGRADALSPYNTAAKGKLQNYFETGRSYFQFQQGDYTHGCLRFMRDFVDLAGIEAKTFPFTEPRRIEDRRNLLRGITNDPRLILEIEGKT
jgi:hypothetical protein